MAACRRASTRYIRSYTWMIQTDGLRQRLDDKLVILAKLAHKVIRSLDMTLRSILVHHTSSHEFPERIASSTLKNRGATVSSPSSIRD